ncbi:hypothetical protein Rsub_01589 [Raphidocelis subcapitata]|uniref:Uncharacterized protein n=1 Tax=Raphidocelis subcapitata TaxID=307507 RepID=A0A2V0NSZ1_9CHLO|nr:hypothetical protein Rsub_01589 [Raphidocelis subcapitata]|eukprot:GBF88690.1 hypothetical protein Rsub_01589 [Raphidocelis subcapitata]
MARLLRGLSVLIALALLLTPAASRPAPALAAAPPGRRVLGVGARPWHDADTTAGLAMMQTQADIRLAADAGPGEAGAVHYATAAAERRARVSTWGWYSADGRW